MPRTRAALRSIEQHAESDIAASTPLPQTPLKGRVPLGEIAGNANNEAAKFFEEQVPPAKKGSGKGRKGNTAKKAKKQPIGKAEEVHIEVLEDERQSTYSPAAEACHDLLKDGSQGMSNRTLAFDYTFTNPCGTYRHTPSRCR